MHIRKTGLGLGIALALSHAAMASDGQSVLELHRTAEKTIEPHRVMIELLVKPQFGMGVTPSVHEDDHFAFCIQKTDQILLYVNEGQAPAWVAASLPLPLEDDTPVRLAVEMHYGTGTDAADFVRVSVNGNPVASPVAFADPAPEAATGGSWFRCVHDRAPTLHTLLVEGPQTVVHDVRVSSDREDEHVTTAVATVASARINP